MFIAEANVRVHFPAVRLIELIEVAEKLTGDYSVRVRLKRAKETIRERDFRVAHYFITTAWMRAVDNYEAHAVLGVAASISETIENHQN